VEYLWCGLPVIYNNYAEITDYIREYNAGWIVDPQDREAIATVLNEIFEHPEQVAERSQNAQRLVRERLTWDKNYPLDGFVRRPSMRHRPLEPLMQLTNDFPNLSQPQPGKTILTQLREELVRSQSQLQATQVERALASSN